MILLTALLLSFLTPTPVDTQYSTNGHHVFKDFIVDTEINYSGGNTWFFYIENRCLLSDYEVYELRYILPKPAKLNRDIYVRPMNRDWTVQQTDVDVLVIKAKDGKPLRHRDVLGIAFYTSYSYSRKIGVGRSLSYNYPLDRDWET